MLITCPECELPVSDKAMACPHCGYPIGNKPRTKRRVPAKRRRLPNGFGQISEIKNRNLRKPFRAMVTVGKNEVGRPICKPLKPVSFFETYNEAYEALLNYNKNPYSIASNITLTELYERWAEGKRKEVNDKTFNNIEHIWQFCSHLGNMQLVNIRPRHIKDIIDSEQVPLTLKPRVKTLFVQLMGYAVELEIVDRNYAKDVKMPVLYAKQARSQEEHHKAFTDKEMGLLWAASKYNSGVDLILIYCYSGWRPREFLELRTDNVDIENLTMVGGMKTAAGTGRTVPIHSKILTFVKERYEDAVSSGRAVMATMAYDQYKYLFKKTLAAVGITERHSPHDCRATFITMAKRCGVDEYAIKYIVGHTISDLTENTYTTRDTSWLKSEIEKIK